MPVKKLYSKYMFDWETRLTTRDNNRVVRPFEWGLDWMHGWHGFNGDAPSEESADAEKEAYFREVNRRIIAESDLFFGYEKPEDFEVTHRTIPGERERSHWLRFTSPIRSPHPGNNTVHARWFPAKHHNKKAVVLLPHWN